MPPTSKMSYTEAQQVMLRPGYTKSDLKRVPAKYLSDLAIFLNVSVDQKKGRFRPIREDYVDAFMRHQKLTLLPKTGINVSRTCGDPQEAPDGIQAKSNDLSPVATQKNLEMDISHSEDDMNEIQESNPGSSAGQELAEEQGSEGDSQMQGIEADIITPVVNIGSQNSVALIEVRIYERQTDLVDRHARDTFAAHSIHCDSDGGLDLQSLGRVFHRAGSCWVIDPVNHGPCEWIEDRITRECMKVVSKQDHARNQRYIMVTFNPKFIPKQKALMKSGPWFADYRN
ncbi:hypothetical protein C8J56DRAFT_1037742 [Mycena floridula]|nr:hypothetical protein C8J56DRAFT_1037742 [Mycena floridula]